MEYTILRSNRRTLALEVKRDGSVWVRAPFVCRTGEIEKFVCSHQKWIEKARLRQSKRTDPAELSEAEIAALRQKAKEILPERVRYFSELTGLSPVSVKITSAKTRFGSCSGKNAICFSLYLMRFSDKAIDYVVLHELAHIKYKNHSAAFYSYIERFMPDYKTYIKELRK